MEQIRAFTNGGWQLILLFTRFYASQVVQEFFYPQYQSPWYNLHMWQLREATNWPHSMSYHHPAFHTTQLEHILYIYSCLCLGHQNERLKTIPWTQLTWRLFSRSQTLESSQGIGQVHVRRFKAPSLPHQRKNEPHNFSGIPPKPRTAVWLLSWGFWIESDSSWKNGNLNEQWGILAIFWDVKKKHIPRDPAKQKWRLKHQWTIVGCNEFEGGVVELKSRRLIRYPNGRWKAGDWSDWHDLHL